MLEAIEAWARVHFPELHADLGPPCDEAALAGLEAAVGRPLPDDFKALYRAHDGQRGSCLAGLFYGLPFLPLARVRAEWQIWNHVLDESSVETLADLNALARSVPPGAVRAVYANRYWIPIAHDYGGNHLGIDLDPGPAGKLGQVINFGRDEDDKYVVAESLAAYFEWMARELEAGNFELRSEGDGGHSFNTRAPAKFHFLDSVKLLFG